MQLTVIGTGYLGATHAAAMAELGHDVLGLDTNAAKVDALNSGVVPFFEPGLNELLRKGIEAGRLRFTTSYEELGAFGDVHFVCVGTPQRTDGYAADLSYLHHAIGSLLPVVKAGSVVVGKSTVPVGTCARIAPMLVAAGSQLVWNPEFLREGSAVDDTLRPDRIVIGAESVPAVDRLREVYSEIIAGGVPVVVTDFATAELVKVAANSFLATKISFINAMAEMCEASGGDVTDLAQALSHDARIGGRFLHAGLGFGGGCLPKDIRAFAARASELGVPEALTFLTEVDRINTRRRGRTVSLAKEMCGGSLDGARVAVLGAAFKPGTDDIRDSPALEVAETIRRSGAAVWVCDPQALDNARRAYPNLLYEDTALAAAHGADLVLLLTEWSEYTEMHPDALGRVVTTRRIIDARNALNRDLWRASGWHYRALGRAW